MLQPVIRPITGTVYELVFQFSAVAEGWRVTVRTGFHTDGASIPRVFWRIIGHPFAGDYVGPAVIHDALYQSEATDRATADGILYALLRANGVGKCRAWTIYTAVRLGGWAAWNNRNEADVANAAQLVEAINVATTPVC